MVVIQEAYEKCRRRYPTVDLDYEVFATRVRAIVTAGSPDSPVDSIAFRDWSASFSELHHEDLFMALACSCGDRIAWEYFADEYLPALRRYAAVACRNLQESEDLAHELVSRLLGGSDAAQADKGERGTPRGKLAGYNGRGSLSGWLRVAVSNAAVDRFRRNKREVSLEEMQERPGGSLQTPPPASGGGMEERLDLRWAPVMSSVLARVIAGLKAQDRLLLSLYYLEGVPLRMIGAHFRVHEATASRRLENLRDRIRRNTERELRKKYGLSRRDISSIWRWISEEENLMLEGLLGFSSSEITARKCKTVLPERP